MRAHYLFRFDDICPSMNWRAWDDIETILCDQRIKPILAVVPDNRDDALRVSAPNARFGTAPANDRLGAGLLRCIAGNTDL